MDIGLIRDLKKIIALGRLRFLSISMALYALGSLLALLSGARFDPARAAFGYLILLLGHLSVHYSNDYFDYRADGLNKSSATSGGSGVLVENPQLLGFAGAFGLMLAVLSVLGAAVFTFAYAFPLYYLGFALLGNLVSWYYTAPPLRMAYRPWGMLASAFSVGFMMPAIGDLSAMGHFSTLFITFATPLFLQALAFILIVQVPDLEGDRRAGKRTLVALYGQGAGFLLMSLSLAAATIFYGAISLISNNLPSLLAAAVSLPFLGMAVYGYMTKNGEKERLLKLVKNSVICYVASILLLDALLAIVLLSGYML